MGYWRYKSLVYLCGLLLPVLALGQGHPPISSGGSAGCQFTGTGAITCTAKGTNQNITLTPSGSSGPQSDGLTLVYGSSVLDAQYAATGSTTAFRIYGGSIYGNAPGFQFWSGGAFSGEMFYDFGATGSPAGRAISFRDLNNSSATVVKISPTGIITTGSTSSTSYSTATNCASAASPAVCGSAAAGRFVIAAGATTVTVNTTAVTANSEILINEDQSLGTALSVTCNTGISSVPAVSSRVAGTSFSVVISASLATNPVCYAYAIVN